jgi:predicted  nucleic acid-binding Zn-ribbon protein
MLEALSILVQLQALDDALQDTRALRARLAKLRKENEESLEMFAAMLAERAERIEEARKFCTAKQNELKATEDDMRRSRARLPSITNQRELNALNKELEIGRRNHAKRTEELTKLRSELEEVETDHLKKSAERDALAEQMKALEEQMVAELAEKEARAEASQAERAAISNALDRPLLARYNRISRGRNGYAVALCNDGSCAACNVAPPPQTFIRLQKQQTVEKCNNCQRLLVYTGEAVAENAAYEAAED